MSAVQLICEMQQLAIHRFTRRGLARHARLRPAARAFTSSPSQPDVEGALETLRCFVVERSRVHRHLLAHRHMRAIGLPGALLTADYLVAAPECAPNREGFHDLKREPVAGARVWQ